MVRGGKLRSSRGEKMAIVIFEKGYVMVKEIKFYMGKDKGGGGLDCVRGGYKYVLVSGINKGG